MWDVQVSGAVELQAVGDAPLVRLTLGNPKTV